MTIERKALAEAIEASIRHAMGNQFRVSPGEIDVLMGGQAGPLSSGHDRVFCKLMDAAQGDRLDAETDGLSAISATRTFRTPAVLSRGEASGFAWLVLEWLDLRPIADSASARRAAQALAEMHSPAHQGKAFGWHRDNYIGATGQENPPCDNWARFFALSRLTPQLERAAQNGLDSAIARDCQRVISRLPAMFLAYRPDPSLLHGDLWHGNMGALANGTLVVFDPACHYGDRDCDLAMTELFGGFPEAFYAGYRADARPADGYETRKLAYSLYHLLNHFNLFGGSYLSACKHVIGQLGRELSSG